MHPNEALIRTFYESFQRRDAEGMIACYHPDIVFSDPIYPELRGGEARAMWRMLLSRGKDLELTFADVRGDDAQGSARWEARYMFSATGRRVHNVVEASFELRDGRIVRHRDRFDMWRWTRMALGPVGLLLGFLPPMQRAIGAKARRGLDEFIAARGPEATRPAP